MCFGVYLARIESDRGGESEQVERESLTFGSLNCAENCDTLNNTPLRYVHSQSEAHSRQPVLHAELAQKSKFP